MTLSNKDIYIRALRSSDIDKRYISWFSDPLVTQFLEARNISILESKRYLKNGIKTGIYYIFAICLSENDLHIGNIKIGPIKRREGISDLVTVLGDRNYWGKGVASVAIKKAIKLGFKQGGIRKYSASINSLNLSSVKAYLKGGFKKEAVIPNYFYNNIDNIKSISDKIYVGIENKDYDMKILKTWAPSESKVIKY